MNRFILISLLLFSNIVYAENYDTELLNDLEQRVNELTDKVEHLQHDNDLLKKKLDSMAKDVDFRILEIERKKSTISPAKSGEAASKKTKTLVSKKPVDPKIAKEKFFKAYEFLKKQEYEKAEVALGNFIKEYPKNEYAANAYYWLAESFSLRKRYDKAAVNYLQSFSKFPTSSKADLSMLKLAIALNKLNKKKESCSMFKKLELKKTKLVPSVLKLFEKEYSQSKCKL